MARKFRKKAGLGALLLPGLPGLGNDEAVEGNEYAKYCPAVLEEILEEVPAKPASKKAAPKSAPEPVRGQTRDAAVLDDSSFKAPEPDSEPGDAEEGEPPNMSWRRGELVEYAEALGLDVTGMTKREILAAIEGEEGE